jgi:hypothetical protein
MGIQFGSFGNFKLFIGFIFVVSMFSNSANATPNYAGDWSINLNHFVSTNCQNFDETPPGSDTIKVTQQNKDVVFTDSDKYYYRGKASKNGFFGVYYFQERGVNVSVKVFVSNLKNNAGPAGAMFLVTNPVTKYSCGAHYSGQAKKKK